MSLSAAKAALEAALAWSQDAESHIQLLEKRVEELRALLDDAHRQNVQIRNEMALAQKRIEDGVVYQNELEKKILRLEGKAEAMAQERERKIEAMQEAEPRPYIGRPPAEAMQAGPAPEQTAAQENMAQARKRIWEHTATQENPNPEPRTLGTIARHITGRIWQDQDMIFRVLSPYHADKIANVLEDYLRIEAGEKPAQPATRNPGVPLPKNRTLLDTVMRNYDLIRHDAPNISQSEALSLAKEIALHQSFLDNQSKSA